MLTITVIVAIWLVLSIPVSVLAGWALRDDKPVGLLGMDGADAVYRRADGTLERVPLGDRAIH